MIIQKHQLISESKRGQYHSLDIISNEIFDLTIRSHYEKHFRRLYMLSTNFDHMHLNKPSCSVGIRGLKIHLGFDHLHKLKFISSYKYPISFLNKEVL